MKQLEGASLAQQSYVFEHKKHHRRIRHTRAAVLVLFLAVWELASDFEFIDSFFFSSPRQVIACFLDMALHQSLLMHIGVTLSETLLSFLLVALLALGSAALLWHSKRLSEILEPYLVILNSLPKSALAPLLIVWLGTGMKTIIIAGISVAIFGAIISLYTGFSQVDPEKQKLIYTLGGTKRDVFFKVVLPASVPTILSTMKVNIGLALVGVIIGEFLAARRGLGFLIIYSSQVFQLPNLITALLILCGIALALYQVIDRMEHSFGKKG